MGGWQPCNGLISSCALDCHLTYDCMDAFQRQTKVELPCSVNKHFCRRIKHHYFVWDLILKYKSLKQLTQLIQGILFINSYNFCEYIINTDLLCSSQGHQHEVFRKNCINFVPAGRFRTCTCEYHLMMTSTGLMDHFWVAFILYFKATPTAKLLIWKWFVILMQMIPFSQERFGT